MREPLPCFHTSASFNGRVDEIDRAQLVDARLREVGARAGVDDVALEKVIALLVGIEDLGADAHLVQTGNRRLVDLVDLRQVGQALLEVLANRRFLREGAGAKQQRRGIARAQRAIRMSS